MEPPSKQSYQGETKYFWLFAPSTASASVGSEEGRAEDRVSSPFLQCDSMAYLPGVSEGPKPWLWGQNTTTRAPVYQGAMLVRKIEPMTWPPWWPHWGLPWWLTGLGKCRAPAFLGNIRMAFFPASPLFTCPVLVNRASLVSQMVKNLPTIQETGVWSLGREDPLEKGMATHSSILAWRIPWSEEPEGYSPSGHKESDMTERLTLSLDFAFVLINYPEAVSTIFLFEWGRPLDMMYCGCYITGLWMILTGNEIVIYLPICHRT